MNETEDELPPPKRRATAPPPIPRLGQRVRRLRMWLGLTLSGASGLFMLNVGTIILLEHGHIGNMAMFERYRRTLLFTCLAAKRRRDTARLLRELCRDPSCRAHLDRRGIPYPPPFRFEVSPAGKVLRMRRAKRGEA